MHGSFATPSAPGMEWVMVRRADEWTSEEGLGRTCLEPLELFPGPSSSAGAVGAARMRSASAWRFPGVGQKVDERGGERRAGK